MSTWAFRGCTCARRGVSRLWRTTSRRSPPRCYRSSPRRDSHLAPRGLRRVRQLYVDGAIAEDGDDGGIAFVRRYPVVVRCAGGTFHVATWPDRHRILRLKLVAAVDEPRTENDHLNPVGSVGVRRAEPTRIPFHHHQIRARLIEIAIQLGHFATVRRQSAPWLEVQIRIGQDESFGGVRTLWYWRRRGVGNIRRPVAGAQCREQEWCCDHQRSP